ncbi:hypothetical protein ASG22_04720 [Chryseobacterium sp. Leaf405]|uniref:hypothetical protein n=1 Tax=Chryseobacterium sp. Leaf405 TaxID=1736367 RepID=UPI0006FB52D0|nr:hypothetical protein [Chryseobacterium sp. Leaf405]KQT26000.1 hypothetical protein ASG22_04720 [Chryseobacterium sp. Leaf405]
MKKMILLAAFGIAGLVSAKPTFVKKSEKQTEKKEAKFRLCGVLVTFYDSDNNPTGSQWFLTDTPTLSSCQAYQSFVQWNLTQGGYTITP